MMMNVINLESRIVTEGDVVLLAHGGHGFECYNSRIKEVKQGPYCGEQDKIRFKSRPVRVRGLLHMDKFIQYVNHFLTVMKLKYVIDAVSSGWISSAGQICD
jgi:hypothetical protein